MVQLYSEIEQLLRKHKFNFPNLSERLQCIICYEILKNAYQSPCGCKFCEKCLMNYLNGECKNCPSKQIDCESVILDPSNIYKDNATNKEISNMVSKCPFEQCTFIDGLFTMSQHISECQYREISCIDCNKKLLEKDLQYHQASDCEMRIVKCKLCDKYFTYKILMETHLNLNDDDFCHNYVDKCPNNCEIDEIVNIKNHLKVCSNRKSHCPFYIFNCTKEKMTPTCLLKHITEEHLSHVQMLIDRILNLENSFMDVTNQLVVLQQAIDDHNKIHEKTTGAILKIQKSNDDLKTEMFSTITNINKQPDIVCYKSCFIWKIEHLQTLRGDAINGSKLFVTSNPFYITQFGYRLCLKIYPNGDGIGKTTHLSVFFVIMKGDYDDLLAWPFQQKIILSLLEQNGGAHHHTETLKPDFRSSCYEKPAEGCNIGSGSPKFISQTEIFQENSIYCKNDSIFIKLAIN